MKLITFKRNEAELNEAHRKVLAWFFAYPTKEISLNDLTRLVHISKTTANRTVTWLAKEGFLKVENIGNLWRLSCNQKHIFNISRKIPFHLELIYASGVIEGILSKIENARAIILFGSYRKGDDIDSSDIDIAVEVLDTENIKMQQIGIISQLGYRKNVKVNLLLFSRKKIDINLFSNIANGIVLHGFLEVKP